MAHFLKPLTPSNTRKINSPAELAHVLETGRTSNSYGRLILVVSDPFMGKLNNHLAGHVRALVTDTIEKDYTQINEKALASHLESILYV